MRLHLSAWLALVSAATAYTACGSSDESKAVGAAGEGGENGDAAAGAGGNSPSTAGSQNNGGSQNAAAGLGGDIAAGGNSGGPALGGQSAGGAAAGAGGAGGDGGAPDSGLPAGCPGMLEDYTQLIGTSDGDAYVTAQLDNKQLVFGLAGDDTFGKSNDGGDCLVGGPGEDDFTSSTEQATYFVGGAGADTYHIDSVNNYVHIADMESVDTIGLSKVAFPFFSNAVGDVPNQFQLVSAPGYATGTVSACGEGSCIVYDPNTGELWRDSDGYAKGSSSDDAFVIGTIVNHEAYVFSLDDFVID
jgi:hypothetical protein